MYEGNKVILSRDQDLGTSVGTVGSSGTHPADYYLRQILPEAFMHVTMRNHGTSGTIPQNTRSVLNRNRLRLN